MIDYVDDGDRVRSYNQNVSTWEEVGIVVKVPLSVYEDIEWIRLSGLVNMSDEIEVEEACRRLEFDEAANWIQSNPESYHRLLLEGPDL